MEDAAGLPASLHNRPRSTLSRVFVGPLSGGSVVVVVFISGWWGGQEAFTSTRVVSLGALALNLPSSFLLSLYSLLES